MIRSRPATSDGPNAKPHIAPVVRSVANRQDLVVPPPRSVWTTRSGVNPARSAAVAIAFSMSASALVAVVVAVLLRAAR